MLSGMKRSLLLIGFQWYYKIQWKLPILAFFSSLLIREGDRFHLIPNRYGPIRAADREGSCCPTGWRVGQGRGRGCGVRCGRDNRRLPRGGGRRHRGWRWGRDKRPARRGGDPRRPRRAVGNTAGRTRVLPVAAGRARWQRNRGWIRARRRTGAGWALVCRRAGREKIRGPCRIPWLLPDRRRGWKGIGWE